MFEFVRHTIHLFTQCDLYRNMEMHPRDERLLYYVGLDIRSFPRYVGEGEYCYLCCPQVRCS